MAFKDVTASFLYLLIVATIGSFLFGFHLAELNAPISVISCQIKETAVTTTLGLPQCIPMGEAEKGLVSSIFTLGGLCGALGAGRFSQNSGRYKTMLGTTAFHVLGPVIEALAFNVPILAAGRLVSGFGAGAATVVVPIYIAELSPPTGRGFFGALTQITTNVGIFVAQLLGLFLSRGQLWRFILATGGIFGAAQAVGLILGGQETPKWLLDHGQPVLAKQVLRRVRRDGYDIEAEVRSWGNSSDGLAIEAEAETLLNNADDHAGGLTDSSGIDSAKQTAQVQEGTVLGPFEVFRDRRARPAVLVVMTVMVIQQFTGINSVAMYGVDVLRDLLEAKAALLNVAVAALNIIVTAASAPLTDRYGRRLCLLLSVITMGSSSLLLGIGINRHVPVVSAVAVAGFVAGFALGLGPIPFILSSELVDTEAVGATQSWALAANWSSTFIVAQFFPLLNKALEPGVPYFLFTLVALLSAVFLGVFLPESKGKANADEVWGRKRVASVRED